MHPLFLTHGCMMIKVWRKSNGSMPKLVLRTPKTVSPCFSLCY